MNRDFVLNIIAKYEEDQGEKIKVDIEKLMQYLNDEAESLVYEALMEYEFIFGE